MYENHFLNCSGDFFFLQIKAIIKRHQEITPTPVEQTAILGLISKIKAAIEKISAAPDLLPSVVNCPTIV